MIDGEAVIQNHNPATIYFTVQLWPVSAVKKAEIAASELYGGLVWAPQSDAVTP